MRLTSASWLRDTAAKSFSGTRAVTQTVLRSAMVISGWVGSLTMLPAATDRLVMLPDTGARTASRRAPLPTCAGAPMVRRRDWLRAYSAAAAAWSLRAWSRSLSEPAPILLCPSARSRFLAVRAKLSAALSLSA